MSCNPPRTSGKCRLIHCPQMSDVIFLVAAVFQSVLVVLAQTQKKQTHFLLNIDAVAK